MKATISRVSAYYNQSQPKQYYDYENYRVNLGEIDEYRIISRIGKGKYSDVFDGRIVESKKKIVIKTLKPVRESKIFREILILKNLKHKNIVSLLDVVQDLDSSTYSLIFEDQKNEELKFFINDLNLNDIKLYCRQILEALDYAHHRGIFHRDIKPHNIIINLETKELKIIDWGLAEFYFPENSYTTRVASRYYKAPELLVDYTYYDHSIDLWGFGCVLAEMVFKKYPFFQGENNEDQLAKIVNILGYEKFEIYIKKYEIPFNKKFYSKNVSFESMLEKKKNKLKYMDAVDLLEKVLIYDHQERLTARECLEHPFFKQKGDPIEEKVNLIKEKVI
ncbi:putative casein kinase II subunit alpha like protein [Dictyocoela muelleri]|nr:putative casein kinase II subunit alpha like protein [Dictyocoela muelleri]